MTRQLPFSEQGSPANREDASNGFRMSLMDWEVKNENLPPFR